MKGSFVVFGAFGDFPTNGSKSTFGQNMSKPQTKQNINLISRARILYKCAPVKFAKQLHFYSFTINVDNALR